TRLDPRIDGRFSRATPEPDRQEANMLLRWWLAAFHLLALGIGLGAVAARSRALRAPMEESRLRSAFLADSLWGLAGFLWIATGLWRAFGGVEKGTAYYLASTA